MLPNVVPPVAAPPKPVKLDPVPVAPLVNGEVNVVGVAGGRLAVPNGAPLVKGEVKVPPEVKPVNSGVLTLLLAGEVNPVLTG